MIGCTADQIFEDVQTGDHIWFDDGKIGGVVKHRDCDRLSAHGAGAGQGARLASEKGIQPAGYRSAIAGSQ